MRDLLRAEGVAIGREHVRTLMRRLAITAIYQQPRTTQRHRAHPVFPYLLRTLTVTRPNHVWAADITYIPMARGFVYLVVGDGLGEPEGPELARVADAHE